MSAYNSSENIGIKIKLIRKNMGITMEQFGELFSPPASKSIVSRWEKGVSVPNNQRLKKIAELGGVAVADLITDGDSKVLIPKQVYNSLPISISNSEYTRLKAIERKYDELVKKCRC